MSQRALLVIDMQNDLCHDVRRNHKVEQMLPDLNRLIDLFTTANQPIFYVRFSLPKGDAQFQRFGDEYCIEGTEGAEIISELQPLKGCVIEKRKHSAFFETSLDQHLQNAGVGEVFLSGLQTHICIMTTAADASFRGYRVVAVKECVVSSDETNKISALHWISSYVGDVLTLDEVIAEFANAKYRKSEA
jgi:nicotinamidase-related amidase